MIYITGDIHGQFKKRINEICEKTKATKDDVILVCGDFGIWEHVYEELVEATKDKECTFAFVDGNHEEYPFLYNFPQVERFGETVGFITNNVFHLLRGRTYNIQGKTFYAMGGAASHDKYSRTPGWDWFSEEEASMELMNRWIDETKGKEVDFVITHECPDFIIKRIYGAYSKPTKTAAFLAEIADGLTFKSWFFGHHHLDFSFGLFHCSFKNIIKINQDDEIDKI